jgi:uncharacterized protein YabN with tetrapyrrole methylase and pyrophosphatase domain
LQKKAAENGFDWPDVRGVIDKIAEELDEVAHEIAQGAAREQIASEIGDLLFACVNLARHLDVDPGQALDQCNNKFYRRFSHVEQRVAAAGRKLEDCSLEELDSYWDEAKSLEK